MSSNFLQQFMAGWQMGQGRNENARRDEYMRQQQEEEMYRRQQEQARQEQEAEERQLRMETYKLQQQEAKLKFNQERLAAAGQEAAMRAEARQRQAMPAPTAAEMGVPEQAPEMAGPSPQDIRQARPVEMMPSPTGGEDVAMPALSAREQQEMAAREWAQNLLKLQAESAAKRAPETPESGKAEAWKRQGDGTYVNVFTGEVRGKPEPTGGGGGGVTPNQESALVDRLSKNWQALSKDVMSMKRQAMIMDTGLTAAKQGNLAAGSQAVLVTFQKILDPTSVVRESEYARSAAGQSVLARIEGAAQQLKSGGAGVPVSELEKFANLAKEFVRKSEESIAGEKARIGKIADRYKIPKELIFSDEGTATETTAGAGAEPPWETVAGVRVRRKAR